MEQEVLQVKKAGDFHYNIFFEKSFEKLSEKLNALNKKGRKICIVTDSNVAPLYLDAVEKDRFYLYLLCSSCRRSQQKLKRNRRNLRAFNCQSF